MLWLGHGGTAMSALVIRDDISSEELRRQARRERDGRLSARLIAIANALDGMDRASAARLNLAPAHRRLHSAKQTPNASLLRHQRDDLMPLHARLPRPARPQAQDGSSRTCCPNPKSPDSFRRPKTLAKRRSSPCSPIRAYATASCATSAARTSISATTSLNPRRKKQERPYHEHLRRMHPGLDRLPWRLPQTAGRFSCLRP